MGGGIGMGSTCKPMAVSFQCMTKFTTNKKKKKKKKSFTCSLLGWGLHMLSLESRVGDLKPLYSECVLPWM